MRRPRASETAIEPKPARRQHLTVRCSRGLVDRLDEWRSARALTRTEAVVGLLAYALDALSGDHIGPLAAREILDDNDLLREEVRAIRDELTRRAEIAAGLIDVLGHKVSAVPLILAHWIAQEPDARLRDETAEQAEERILGDIGTLAREVWDAERRHVLPMTPEDREALETDLAAQAEEAPDVDLEDPVAGEGGPDEQP